MFGIKLWRISQPIGKKQTNHQLIKTDRLLIDFWPKSIPGDQWAKQRWWKGEFGIKLQHNQWRIRPKIYCHHIHQRNIDYRPIIDKIAICWSIGQNRVIFLMIRSVMDHNLWSQTTGNHAQITMLATTRRSDHSILIYDRLLIENTHFTWFCWFPRQ